jgi:hypothetical protein
VPRQTCSAVLAVTVGVDAVCEGRRGLGQVGGVEGEFVGFVAALGGDEDLIGPDGFEDGEVVYADLFVACYGMSAGSQGWW